MIGNQETSRRVRRTLSAIIAAFAVWGGPVAAPAAAAEFGMSDGRPALFDAQQLHELDFTRVRLVVPWDAGTKPGTWNLWLERAALQGFPVMVAMNIDQAGSCEPGSGGNCSGPSVAAYATSLRALLRDYPGIDAVEAWNEPNQADQPTAGNASLAARYFDAAFAACAGRCTAVAGNLLDSPSMGGYLAGYRGALRTTPAVWGIHDYADATYFGRSGLDQMLAVTDGPVWITEVGGLVALGAGAGGLAYDEHRAADSLRWLFSLAAQTPRLERMYLYGMWQEPANPFDSALLRVDNTERESMVVARAAIGPRRARLAGPEAPLLPAQLEAAVAAEGGRHGGASATAAAQLAASRATAAAIAARVGLTGRLRLDGKRVVLFPSRRVGIVVRCVGQAACRGTVQVVAPRWSYSRRVSLKPGAVVRVKVRLPARIARGVGKRASRTRFARVCDTGLSCGKQTRSGLVKR